MSAANPGTRLFSRVTSPEAIDPRFVFRGYAWLAVEAGVLLCLWPNLWSGAHLPEWPYGRAMLIRIFGSIIIGAVCCAVAFARIPDLKTRRSALGLFAAAHAIVAAVVVMQRMTILGAPVSDAVNLVALTTAIVLLYLWWTADDEIRDLTPGEPSQTVALFSAPADDEGLRTRYEQQIREAAGQEERHRLARDLHDSIKQQIFVI